MTQGRTSWSWGTDTRRKYKAPSNAIHQPLLFPPFSHLRTFKRQARGSCVCVWFDPQILLNPFSLPMECEVKRGTEI